jgi:hypothetical protein
VGYRLRWRGPGAAQQNDVRSWITIEADELPAPLRFYFLSCRDDTGAISFEYLGHAIESGPVSRDSVANVDVNGFGLTPEQSRWIRENLRSYQAMAERAIAGDRDGARRVYTSIAKRTVMKRVQGKRWSDEELALTAEVADVLREAGLSEMEVARELRMSRTTLYRARKRASKTFASATP